MADSEETRISISHLYKSFDKVQVLKDINLEVLPGAIYGLIGPSGCGKTTLINIITGISSPTAGDVSVAGIRMPSLAAMSDIGYMAQSDAVYGMLSGKENLRFFGSLYRMKRAELEQRIDYVAELLNLSDALDRKVCFYSGGMKRRLSLAAALLHDPTVLLLDEATVGIDPLLRETIWEEFNNISLQGKIIFVTTHVMDEAEKCGQIALMRDGVIVASGSPGQIKLQAGAQDLNEAFIFFSKGGGGDDN
jgi:ABC-2 type transport system ATP-binding protein